MRKVVLLYVFFQLIYSASNAQIKLLDFISPASGAINPTHIDSLGKGGYMVVPSLSDRNAIPTTRRKLGMLVFVQAVDSIYKLNATSLDNSNWVALGLYSAAKIKADSTTLNRSLLDTAAVLRAKILGDSTRISSRITNVDNTSDLNKPISTATQSALDLKANLASPTLTGIPTAPTPADGTSNTQIATTAFVNTSITASSNSIGGVSSSTIAQMDVTIAAATPNNTPNTLVKRDGSGNFSATTISAELSGNASTATKLANSRTLYGNAFDGTANLTQAIAGQFGGTGVNNSGKTITLGGNVLTASDFTTAGNFSTTLTTTGVTNITLPTTGTIATLAGTESLTNKTIVSPTITSPTISSPSLTGSPTAPTPAANANSTEVATAEFVKSQISNAATDATTTAKGIIKLANDLGGTADLPTVNSVGGVSSSTVASINTTINAATSNNTVSTLVKRDASGNFSAGTITAALTGNVTGDVTGNLTGNVVGNVTGNLTGNASTTTKLETARTIYGNSFDGTANLSQAIGGTYGGTGVNNGNKTITLGGNILTANDFTTAGNFSTTLTSTGVTNITLPTTGTIATLAGTETLTNKTLVSASLTGSPTATTPSDAATNTEVATAAFVLSRITASSNSIGGVSSATIAEIASDIAAATSSNTANTLVKRDGSGNFSAGTVTANLAGNASTATKLAATKTIYGNTFDGSVDLSQAIGGTYGGTGVNNGNKTITLGGNILTASDFTTAGNFSTTLTSIGATNVTLPTTGTIATLAGTETLTNKTIVSPIISSPSLTGSPTAPTPAANANSTEVATAAFVKSQITNAATDATTTAKGIIKLANDLGGTADLPTVNSVGGVSSSTVTTINTTINAATASSTVNTLVKRDGSGNFSAGVVTGNLVGNVTGSLTGNVTGNVTGNLTGNVTGNLTGNVVGNVTGNLAGNASTTTKLETARTIYGNSFDGTTDLGQAISGTYGGTGVNNGSKTITLGGNILTANDFTTSGNFSTNLTSTGVTNVTLPTTGTIATLSGTETLTNKTIVSPTISSPSLTGSPTAPTPTAEANGTEIATAAFVKSRISSSATDATTTAKGIIKLANDLGGTADLPTVNSVGGVSSSTVSSINTTINAATSTNSSTTIVKRDASGNFSAGTITASLAGNASTTTQLQTARTIYGNSFDGTTNLTQAIAGQFGGTGVNNSGKTITLGGNVLTASDFTTAGNFSTTLTSTGVTNITLPTTGTIATLAGTETLTNKTIVSPTITSPTISSPSLTGSPTAPTPAANANSTEVATAAFVKSQISNAATDATTTAKGIIKLANDLGGTADLPTVNSVGGVNSSTIATINTTVASATTSNTVNTLVKRDGSGNFSAGTITASLTGNVTGNVVGNVTGNLAGNASTTTKLETARTIYGNSFDGTANLTQAIAGTYGGTGVNNGSNTITLGGNILTASDFTTAGNFSTTLTSTGATNIILPTTGTLTTLAGTETLTNKTIVSPTITSPTISSPSLTGSPTAPTPVADANGTEVATAAFVKAQITSSATGATSTSKGIIQLAGDLGGTADLPIVNTVGGVSSSTITTIASNIASATSINTPSTLVKRDASGNFSAGIITASLSGNASTTTQLQTARNIYGNNFDGTVDLTQAISGTYGGTGVNNGSKTITLGGNLITTGNYSTTLTSAGTTNVTLPTTGTLATLAGTETLTNKTIENVSLTGVPTAPTASTSSNSSQVATTKFVNDFLSSTTVSGDKIMGIIPVINGGTGQSTYTDGQVLIGTTSGTLSKTTLTAGSGVTITNGNGSITVSATGSGGTVTSVNPITVSASGSTFSSSVSNSTSNPTISLTIPLAAESGTTAGLLSKTDYDIFNAKQGALTAGSGISIVGGTISATGLTTSNLSSSAGITNGQLANNKITLGSSDLVLGGTYSSVTGLDAINATNFIGALTGNVTGDVTGNLTGNASTATQLATQRSIYGNNFDGTANLGQAIAGTYGGTGVNNGSKTITLGGNILTASDFTTAGSFSTTLTSTGATNITLPTTGTIATLAGTETLTNKTIVSPSLTGTPTAPTPSDAANSTEVATAAFVLSKITASSNSIGGVSSSTINTIATEIAAATSSNTANTLVKRDGSGNFSASVITATLAGNASTTTQLQTARSIYGNNFNGGADLTAAILGTYGGTGVNNGTKTISLGGNISTTSDFITAGNYSTTLTSTGITNITLPTTGTIATLAGTETLTNKTIESPTLTGVPTAPTPSITTNTTQIATTEYVKSLIASTSINSSQISGTIATDIASATSSNTANTIVKRDGSGNFSANIITATLAGNASTSTQLATPRSIYGNNFNGGADLTAAILGTYGGTGVDNGTKTISLGGNISTTADFITAGNYSTTLTSTGLTNITLPTTGTIATLAGTETLTNKTIVSPTISSPSLTGSATATTADISSNNTLIATTAFVRSRINADTALLIQKSAISGILSDYTATLSSAKTFIDKNDTATMMQRRYISDVVPVATRVTAIENSTTTLGSTGMAIGGTYTSVTGLSSVSSSSFIGTLSGTASTANKLTTSKNINGVAFDGSADITIAAASNTLTGTTLASNVTASSLTSVGTITSGVWSGTAIAVTNGGTGLTSIPTNGQLNIGNGTGFTRATLTPGSGISVTNASGGITIATSGITSANLSPTAGITNAQLANSKTTLGSSDLVLGGTVTSVAGLTSLTSTNLIGTLSGTASTANKLTATKNINGVAFDGSADITVTAAAGTLTGATLASNVTASSLTSVGTITSGIWSGTTIAIEKGGTGLTAAPTSGQIDIGTGSGTFTRTTLTPGLGISIANGSGSIGITALAGTISGTTLASNVVTSSLTGVGTITTGTWSGTTIAVAKGGTGATTLSGVLLGNGTGAISTATEGTNYSLVREINDEFTVTSAQATTSTGTSGLDGVVSAVFTLAQIPNTKSLVKIYVNGVRISSRAFTFYTSNTVGSGTNTTTPTINIGYIPFQNGNYRLTTSDRVQIDYYY